MEPVLKDGDRILVNKMIKGARLFNVFAALDNEDFTIHRMPGWGNFKRNDILVFNFPYQQNRWDGRDAVLCEAVYRSARRHIGNQRRIL